MGNGESTLGDHEVSLMLHKSAWRGDVAQVRELVERGVDIETPTEAQGRTSLHLAALNNQKPVVRLLLEAGGAVDPKDVDGITPLMIAVDNAHVKSGDDADQCAKVMNKLVEYGANVETVDAFGRNVWDHADGDSDLIDLIRSIVENHAAPSLLAAAAVDVQPEMGAEERALRQELEECDNKHRRLHQQSEWTQDMANEHAEHTQAIHDKLTQFEALRTPPHQQHQQQQQHEQQQLPSPPPTTTTTITTADPAPSATGTAANTGGDQPNATAQPTKAKRIVTHYVLGVPQYEEEEEDDSDSEYSSGDIEEHALSHPGVTAAVVDANRYIGDDAAKLEHARRMVAQLNMLVRRTGEDMEAAKATIARQNEDVASLQTLCLEYRAERDAALSKLRTISDEHEEELQGVSDAREIQAVALVAKVESLDSRLRQMSSESGGGGDDAGGAAKDELDRLRRHIVQMTADLAVQTERADQAMAQTRRLEADTSDREGAAASARADVEAAHTEAHAARLEAEQLRAALAQHEGVHAENAALRGRVADLEAVEARREQELPYASNQHNHVVYANPADNGLSGASYDGQYHNGHAAANGVGKAAPTAATIAFYGGGGGGGGVPGSRAWDQGKEAGQLYSGAPNGATDEVDANEGMRRPSNDSNSGGGGGKRKGGGKGRGGGKGNGHAHANGVPQHNGAAGRGGGGGRKNGKKGRKTRPPQ